MIVNNITNHECLDNLTGTAKDKEIYTSQDKDKHASNGESINDDFAKPEPDDLREPVVDNDDVEEADNDELIVGIDLGTRFSCISVWRNGRFEIIPDGFGNRTVPSMVAFYRSVKLVGWNALSMREVSPTNTIVDVKRIIGRKFTDPEIENVQRLISYKIADDESSHHNIMIHLDRDDTTLNQKLRYRPEEVCAHILIELKRMASSYLRREITKAVITVPAYSMIYKDRLL